jgi:hypothetical protein
MHELDNKVVRTPHGYERQTWLAGEREDLGKVIDGWSGKETFIKAPFTKAIVVFEVRARSSHHELDHKLLQEEKSNPLIPNKFGIDK